MPKSKVRKKNDAPIRRRPGDAATKTVTPESGLVPGRDGRSWSIGLAYLVVYYLANQSVPVMKDIGGWNFAVGFGIMLVGLVMAVRWR